MPDGFFQVSFVEMILELAMKVEVTSPLTPLSKHTAFAVPPATEVPDMTHRPCGAQSSTRAA